MLDAARTTATPGQFHAPDDVDYFEVLLPRAGLLAVETKGSTATRGTVWQDGAMLARADGEGERQNFRLSVRVQAGPVVIAVAGNGRQTGRYTLQVTVLTGYLENPGVASFQSGIGVLSGWVCDADLVEMRLGTSRRKWRPMAPSAGTRPACVGIRTMALGCCSTGIC